VCVIFALTFIIKQGHEESSLKNGKPGVGLGRLGLQVFFVKNMRIFYFFLAFNIFSYVIIADSEKSKSEGKNVALPALLATVALKKNLRIFENVWNAVQFLFLKNLNFFFLLKFNKICTLWIVLMS